MEANVDSAIKLRRDYIKCSMKPMEAKMLTVIMFRRGFIRFSTKPMEADVCCHKTGEIV